jgi:manganese/iron transport system ATP-binding protein
LTPILYHPAAHQTAAPALELTDVSVHFGDVHALEQVSLRLQRGDQLALVGPNGAGKSTLFNVIAGVVRPDRGTVQIYGSQPGGHICVGYVPQRSRIDANFPVTVRDVVQMGRTGRVGLLRWPSRGDRTLVREAMDRVGIGPLAQRQIGELSGGQQQRVFLARALAQEAEILLMDEPLTGLDVPSQEGILETLDGLRAQGITVLVATHDLNQASRRFPVVALINRRLIAFGTPEQALTPKTLAAAFGSHIHIVHTSEGDLLVADTCCEDDHPLPITAVGRDANAAVALPAYEVSVDGERAKGRG